MLSDYPYSLDTRGLSIDEEIAQIEKAGFQKRWGSVWEWERYVPAVPARVNRLLPYFYLLLAVALTIVLFCGIIPDFAYSILIYFMGGIVAAVFCVLSISTFSKNSRIIQESKKTKVEVYQVKRLNPVEKMIREIYFQPGTFRPVPAKEEPTKYEKYFNWCPITRSEH